MISANHWEEQSLRLVHKYCWITKATEVLECGDCLALQNLHRQLNTRHLLSPNRSKNQCDPSGSHKSSTVSSMHNLTESSKMKNVQKNILHKICGMCMCACFVWECFCVHVCVHGKATTTCDTGLARGSSDLYFTLCCVELNTHRNSLLKWNALILLTSLNIFS